MENNLEENFKNILIEDEEIISVTQAYKKGYRLNRTFVNVLLTACVVIWPVVIYILSWIPNYIYQHASAKKYFVCLTNKRLIVKKGVWTTNYDIYALNNLSNIYNKQTIFDNENSCSIVCELKSASVNDHTPSFKIYSIQNGFEFSKLIQKNK